jgi:DNA replication protein DnaC
VNNRQETGCRACAGSTMVLDEETGEARPCVCRERVVKHARARKLITTLPRIYLETHYAVTRPPICWWDARLRKPIERYVAHLAANIDEGRGLWFTGPSGTGKTIAAVAVARAAAEQGHTVTLKPVPKLLREIRRAYSDRAEDDQEAFYEQLESIDLLVLDDLGAQQTTEWVLEQFYSIVQERTLNKRAIIVTTNLDVEELERQVSPRVVSRLYEMCGKPILLDGPDHRRLMAVSPLMAAETESATASLASSQSAR